MNNGKRIMAIIKSIDDSLVTKNYFAAMSSTLILIEICGSVEFEKANSKERYLNWVEEFLLPFLKDKYNSDKYLNKENLYYLRCSLLHQGSTDPTTQRAYYKNEFNRVYDIIPIINNIDSLEIIVTDVENPPEKINSDYIEYDSNHPTVFVDVRYFCKKVMKASIHWLKSKSEDKKFHEKDMNIFSVGSVAVNKDDSNRLIIVRG